MEWWQSSTHSQHQGHREPWNSRDPGTPGRPGPLCLLLGPLGLLGEQDSLRLQLHLGCFNKSNIFELV